MSERDNRGIEGEQGELRDEFLKSRRGFLIHSGLVLGAATLATGGLPFSRAQALEENATPFDGGGRLPILQGLTDATSAQFRVVIDAKVATAYRILDPRGVELAWTKLERFVHQAAPGDAVEHISVTGLRLGADYKLQVIEEASGKVLDERLFRALDQGGTLARYALISCMNDYYGAEQVGMWNAVAQAAPSIIFLIGDSCYADIGSDGTEGGIWHRFLETRKLLEGFRWKRLIPMLAVWDDHDFGFNNGDKTNPVKDGVKTLFRSLMESTPVAGLHEKGPGISSVARLFGQRFFLMDDRYFRDPENTPRGLHWGEEQEEWLMEKLASSKEPAWLLSGSQFFGGYLGKDAFEAKHPYQFERVMKRLARIEAPVAFGSGDVHFTELMTIEPKLLGYQTYELTSSSLHSVTFPGIQFRAYNPRRIDSTWKHNFLLVESDASGGRMKIRARSIGSGGAVRIDESFEVVRG